jgi:hypothetical protein
LLETKNMTKEQIIAVAVSNGYVMDKVAPDKCLEDPAFFKAAFLNEPDEKIITCSQTSPCPKCGTLVTVSASGSVPAWSARMVQSALAVETGGDGMTSVLEANIIK